MEQKLVLKNQDSFEPKDVFECGQCFRWNKEDDGSYTGIFGNNILNVKKENQDICIKGLCDGDINNICNQYFDLSRDYETIKDTLSKVDDNLKTSIEYGNGIRILNQDLWEMIISFIISANNNIPRIKKIINNLSKQYGRKIIYNNKEYYTFPTSKELSNATIEDLRSLGLGFRDKYIFKTTKMINDKIIDVDLMKDLDTKTARKQLNTLQGVGPKVADCILLFSTLKRFDVFPIDVWVRRVMNDLYIHNEDESKVDKRELQELAKEKFGDLEGIAQQYLFYWKREQ